MGRLDARRPEKIALLEADADRLLEGRSGDADHAAVGPRAAVAGPSQAPALAFDRRRRRPRRAPWTFPASCATTALPLAASRAAMYCFGASSKIRPSFMHKARASSGCGSRRRSRAASSADSGRPPAVRAAPKFSTMLLVLRVGHVPGPVAHLPLSADGARRGRPAAPVPPRACRPPGRAISSRCRPRRPPRPATLNLPRTLPVGRIQDPQRPALGKDHLAGGRQLGQIVDDVLRVQRPAPEPQAVVGIEHRQGVQERLLALVEGDVPGEEEHPPAGQERLVGHGREDGMGLESQFARQARHAVLRDHVVVRQRGRDAATRPRRSERGFCDDSSRSDARRRRGAARGGSRSSAADGRRPGAIHTASAMSSASQSDSPRRPPRRHVCPESVPWPNRESSIARRGVAPAENRPGGVRRRAGRRHRWSSAFPAHHDDQGRRLPQVLGQLGDGIVGASPCRSPTARSAVRANLHAMAFDSFRARPTSRPTYRTRSAGICPRPCPVLRGSDTPRSQPPPMLAETAWNSSMGWKLEICRIAPAFRLTYPYEMRVIAAKTFTARRRKKGMAGEKTRHENGRPSAYPASEAAPLARGSCGLVDYRKRYGDCRVPGKWPKNQWLGKWVKNASCQETKPADEGPNPRA